MMAKLVSVQDTAFESRPGSKEPEKEKLAALKEKFSQVHWPSGSFRTVHQTSFDPFPGLLCG